MRFFEIQRSASKAIENAALCRLPSGKRHPHQRRIPRAVLELAEDRLQGAVRRLEKARDFDALFIAVKKETGKIHGIGPLTVYDVAHRLGAFFGKLPERVYLHAGTRIGARAFGITGDSFSPRELPNVFSGLTAAEIEDCLCIYKDKLLNTRRQSRRRSRCL